MDPKKRISASKALKHPWFEEVKDKVEQIYKQ